MNTTNLIRLISFLKTIEPSTFNMGALFSTTKHCFAVHFYMYRNGDEPVEIPKIYDFMSDYTGIPQKDNKFAFLFSGYWRHEKTNTIDHAIYRINSLLEGYEPDHITEELQKEIL